MAVTKALGAAFDGPSAQTGTAWARPRDIDEAVGLLERADGKTRIVAGCTAVPPLVLTQDPEIRLAVDLLAVEGLSGIDNDGSALSIGATTTIEELAGDPRVGSSAPMLARVAGGIGDEVLRGLATAGGNVAARPPALFELPVVLAALDADLSIVGAREGRVVRGSEFSASESPLAPDELLVGIELPGSANARWAYRKLTTNLIGYGVAALAICCPDDRAPRAFAALGSPIVQRLDSVERALAAGGKVDVPAVAAAACRSLRSQSDALASAGYRICAIRTALEQELRRLLAGGDE